MTIHPLYTHYTPTIHPLYTHVRCCDTKNYDVLVYRCIVKPHFILKKHSTVSMVVQVCSTNARPTLFLRTKLAPNSMQIRTGSAILSNLVRLWYDFGSSLVRICFEFASSLQRRYSRPKAEVQQTYSRGTTIFLIAMFLLCNFTSCELGLPLLTHSGLITDL